MDFLANTEVRKFPPKGSSGVEGAQGLGLRSGIGGNGMIPFFLSFFLSFSLSLIFDLSEGTKGSGGGELRHLAGSPGGGGDYQGPVRL